MFPKRIWIGLVLALTVPAMMFADHVLVISKNGYSLLEQDSAGNVTLHKIDRVIDMGKPDPVVPPIVVPPVVGTLPQVVKTATSAVPDYPDKTTHRRAMAFGMSFLSQATGNTEVAKARATVRQFCDAAVGADASKWSAWWATVDAKLNSLSLTPATYTAALGEMATALTADLPPAAAENVPAEAFGAQTYGLNPDFIKMLMEILLPLLFKMLGL